MKSLLKKILVLCVLSTALGCATNRKNSLALMGASFAVGGTMGAVAAPKGESAMMHGLLWGGLTAAASGVAGHYLFDSEKASKKRREEVAVLRAQISEFKGSHSKSLVFEGSGNFGRPLPKKYQKLLRPGRWKIYELDEWIEDEGNENTLIHRDRMIEMNPPVFNLGGKE